MDSFLEYFAAWTTLDGDYASARETVERLLAGRKALRDFAQPASRHGLPKSPLDPAADTVFRCTETGQTPDAARGRPLWVKARETLDAVSILKRLSGHAAGAVPSTSRLAVEAILPRLREMDLSREIVARFEGWARELGSGVDLGDFFYPGRLDEVDVGRIAAQMGGEEPARALERLRKKALEQIGLAQAPAYYTILIGDGDGMGALVDRLAKGENGLQQHRGLTTALSEFAGSVPSLVDGHGGCAVYAGGDDVFALLPVPGAPACARDLNEAYGRALREVDSEPGRATFSAGIAIVHHMDPLQESVAHARAAERAAKDAGRDRLCVAYHPRGGAPTQATLTWDQSDRWDGWIEAFREGLARGVPYELRALAREFEPHRTRGSASSDPWSEIPPDRRESRLRAEAERIMKRKGGYDPARHALPGNLATPRDLDDFASLLIIARFLSRPEAAG